MKKLLAPLCLSITLLISSSAFAQKLENSFDDWNVLTTVIDSKKVCYIASTPSDRKGNIKERDDSYILVSWFDSRKPEVSVAVGYEYKNGGGVKLTTDKQKFILNKIQDNLAWSNTEEEDRKIISSLKSDLSLEIYAESNFSTYSIDSYSLKGFTKAFEEMLKLCKSREIATADSTN